jgi:hypothetical protein
LAEAVLAFRHHKGANCDNSVVFVLHLVVKDRAPEPGETVGIGTIDHKLGELTVMSDLPVKERVRQLPTVAEDTACRRAASASDNSPFNTANTTWICSSTDTCRDGFCCLLTQPSFLTPQLNPLPESLTHSTSQPA